MSKASPKKEIAYAGIKKLILQNKLDSNQSLPPAKILAKKFKISIQPLRAALTQLIDEEVIYPVQGSGYYVKKAIKPVAFVYQLDNYMKQQVLTHIHTHLAEKRIRVLESVLFPDQSLDEVLDLKQISGVIFFSNLHITPSKLKLLTKQNIPLVNIMGKVTGTYDTFSPDYSAGMNMLLTHLYGKGHKHVVYIDNRNTAPPFSIMRESFVKYSEQLGIQATRVVIDNPVEIPEAQIQELVELIKMPKKPASAIIGNTTQTAVTFLPYLEREQITVPKNLSISGFGWSKDIEYITAPYQLKRITTIEPDYQQTAVDAADRLLEQINGKNHTPQQFAITPKLVKGDSVK